MPPERRGYLREMVELVTADGPGIVCLQEVPVWALRHLEAWSGMRALGAIAAVPRVECRARPVDHRAPPRPPALGPDGPGERDARGAGPRRRGGTDARDQRARRAPRLPGRRESTGSASSGTSTRRAAGCRRAVPPRRRLRRGRGRARDPCGRREPAARRGRDLRRAGEPGLLASRSPGSIDQIVVRGLAVDAARRRGRRSGAASMAGSSPITPR